MNLGIVGISNSTNKFCPRPGMLRDECSETGEKCPVEPLGLPIRLRMIGRCQGVIDPEMGTHELENLRSELGPIIRDDVRWRAVCEYPVLQKHLSDINGRDSSHWYGARELGEPVCHYQDESMPRSGPSERA